MDSQHDSCLLSGARLVLLALAALALGAPPAAACLVCIEQPEDTLTERVWDAEAVVFARSTREERFLYQPVEILVGGIEAPIAFVVNSVERTRMASDPGRVALFLREPRGWSLAGHGGTGFADLVRTMLANEAAWSDEVDDPDRFAAFAALHAHPDPTIRRVALTELARAPYVRLRGVEVALEVDWLAARLRDPAWFGWWPILTQMLGLHDEPAAHALVRARALEVDASFRAPWLSALVEIDGSAGIDRILAVGPKGDAALAAVRALAAHAAPGHDLALELAAALRGLATRVPEVAAEAVAGLAALGDFSLAPRVADLLASGAVADAAEAFVLWSYLAQADAGRAVPRDAAEARSVFRLRPAEGAVR